MSQANQMISNYEMQEEVQIMIELLLEKFSAKLPSVEIKKYKVQFSQGGQTAGMFSYMSNGSGFRLNFNPIIMKDNWKDFEQTVIHEVAHLCAFLWRGEEYTRGYKRISHGATWKDIMRFFEADVKRCHNYDVSVVKSVKAKKTFSYACNCMTHELTIIRHNRSMRGTSYRCNKCGATLKKA
jgi:SprT protein